MENLIGIDISNDVIDVCILVGENPYYYQYENNEDGFLQLLSLYHNFKVSSIGFEATGNYHKKLEKYLFGNGVKPFIFKPLVISNFRKTLPIHGKTDKGDSYAIVRYLQKGDLQEYYEFPTRDFFKPILSSLDLYDKQIRQTKNLIHSIELLPDTVDLLDDLKNTVKFLEMAQSSLELNSIKVLYEMCPESKIIRNDIKGVGDKLMLCLIPMIYDNFDKFTLSQINAYFGLNPVEFQSGTSIKRKPKMSKHGNSRLMKVLYFASISSVRNNPILKEKYDRLKANGKPSKVALVSIMSHLLRAIVVKLSIYTKRELKK